MTKRTADMAGLTTTYTDTLWVKRTRVTADDSSTDEIDILLPPTSGTLALSSAIPGSGSFLTLGAPTQTVTSVKTFSAAPIIPSITNGAATIALPSVTGTLALTSEVPTNADYVDKTTNQTVGGVKTFSSAPVISSISNTGTLTLPTATGTLALTSEIPTNSTYVDLTTTQNVTGVKTFSSTILAAGGVQATGGQFFVDDIGSAVVPAITIDNNSGIFSIGATGSLNFATNGVERMELNNAQLDLETNFLVNAKLKNNSCSFIDATNNSRVIVFDSSGSSNSTTTTIASVSTANRTLTLPNTSTTLMGQSVTETCSGAKTFTGGVKVGSSGSTSSIIYRNSFTYGTVINTLASVALPAQNISSAGFSGVPHVVISVKFPSTGGAQQWDRIYITVDGANTTATSLQLQAVNFGAGNSSGTGTIMYTCTE